MAISEQQVAMKNQTLQNIFRKLGLWTTPENLPKGQAQGLYALAYDLYQRAQCREAQAIFLHLLLCTEFDAKNLMGLAACCHAEKNYAIALSMYQLCIQSGLNYPIIHFHISDCLLHLGNRQEAISELKKILETPHGSATLQKLHTKARGMIDLLELNMEK